MGIPPRPAFGLTVTVELSLGGPVAGDLVATRLAAFEAAGMPDAPLDQHRRPRRRQPAGDGIEDAVVDILDLDLRTRSGRRGPLRVPARAAGRAHGPRRRRAGSTPKTQPLAVPGRPEDYLVELTPLP